jgi:transposase
MDWGDQKHAIALQAHGQGTIERLELEHDPLALHQWLEGVRQRFAGQPVGIAIEASKGAVVAALLEHPWLIIYPIHPATSRRFSLAFTPSRAANDAPDAYNLLEILRSHRHRLRPLLTPDAPTRRLSQLVEARRKLIDQRTMLGNQLTSLLKSYYPQALAMTGETRHSRLSLDFLARWPELASLQKARAETLRRFYYAHAIRRPEFIEQRLESARQARALSSDRILIETSQFMLRALLAQLRALEAPIKEMEKAIAETFAAQADAAIFSSLPGAGETMAPRLCVLFGTDRSRWRDASELQKYYGIAPVIEASGKTKWTHWRWSAPKFARQTLVEWAGLSVRYCDWAAAFYTRMKEKQKSHSAIMRALAFKWLRILWRCWQTRTPYDDSRYVRHLREKGSPLADLLPA